MDEALKFFFLLLGLPVLFAIWWAPSFLVFGYKLILAALAV